MFKKNDMVQIKVDSIIRFFDLVAEQDVFELNPGNQTWLWRKLQFIIDFLNHNNLDSITQEKLIELIYVDKHKSYFTANTHEISKNNAISLDELIQEEPIVKGMSNILSSAWGLYLSEQQQKENKDKFSKNHFFSIINLSIISFLIAGVFYSWKLSGVLGIASIMGIFAYNFFKKIAIKLKNQQEQNAIRKEIKQVTNPNDSQLVNIFDKLGLEPWTNDREVNEALIRLKNKTVYFVSIYNKKEANRNPSMILDLERMWNQHIPLFIDITFENPAHKKTIIETIHSMENVLQKHIETLFWDDKIEVSAKQRFWLAKETEKSIY